jgi:hypothetical protein
MGLHITKNLLHSKGNGHQTEEAVHRMGEKSFPAMDLALAESIWCSKTQLPRINDTVKNGEMN